MFNRLQEIFRFRALKRFFTTHERLLIPLMLLVGVVIDFVTFRSIQVSTAFLLLSVYTILAAMMILVIHRHDANHQLLERPSFYGYLRLVAPLILQLSFGALLSAILIFYWFSGSFTVSWPIFTVLLALMLGNEAFREHYLRPTVQMAVFYFVLLSTLATGLPSVLGSISPTVFVVSTVASLVLMAGYLFLLYRVRPDLRFMRPSPVLSVIAIFSLMNAAYFLNLIPPIPLSLVESGVYHNVERRTGEYILESEEQSWWQRLLPSTTIHVDLGDRVYAYASIFAPVDLNTTVIHHWQRLEDNGWVSVNRLSYSIAGGREEGYRGYSYITNHSEGKWRVDVETTRGQVIGRIRFTIEAKENSP